jgi:hypothetical protein
MPLRGILKRSNEILILLAAVLGSVVLLLVNWEKISPRLCAMDRL